MWVSGEREWRGAATVPLPPAARQGQKPVRCRSALSGTFVTHRERRERRTRTRLVARERVAARGAPEHRSARGAGRVWCRKTSGARMTDETIATRIERLVAEEHQLRDGEQEHGDDEAVLAETRGRLREVEVELDRCWDLLRQRRARRKVGADADDAALRDADTVEGYLQ